MAKKGFDLAASVSQAMGKGDVSNLDTMRIEYIDYDLIDSNEKNFYELSDLQALANSIALDGLQQPLVATTSPVDPSRVLLISGHRRHAAIGMLIHDEESPRPDLRRVPFLRREYQDSDLMELQLILANSTSRVLTSAETMRQAERVEALLYQLKEKGHDFPGKMRAQVAQACQVSESKLARLKVIREGLREHFMKTYQSGALSEQAAYAIARMPEALQEMLEKRKKSGKLNGYVAEYILRDKDYYLAPKHTCKNGDACTNCSNFLAKDASANGTWEMCHGHKCCRDCGYERNKCKYVCPTVAAKLEKEKAKNDAEKEKQAEKDKKMREQRIKIYTAHAQRIEGAADDAGKSLHDLISFLGGYLISNLKRGLNPKTEYDYLTGLTVDIENLAQLCRTLGVSADWLLGLSDSPAAAAPAASEWVSHYAGPPPEGALVAVRRYNGGYGIFRYSGIGYCSPDDPEMTPLNVQCKSYCVLPKQGTNN